MTEQSQGRDLRSLGLPPLPALFSLLVLCLLPACAGTTRTAPPAHAPAETLGDYEGAAVEEAQRLRILQRQPARVADTRPGIVPPYPLDHIYGFYYDCRPGGRHHKGLDLGGTGPDHGLGTPVRAMVRSRIVFIGTPESDPQQFGVRDRRAGHTERRGVRLPRSAFVGGYGRVYFFTRDYGSWYAGVTLVMEALESEIAGYQVRYLHLGAVHPELQVGDVVEAGQEVGLMGGTAVLRDLPHVHIDIEDERGRRLDVAPLLGLEADRRRSCR